MGYSMSWLAVQQKDAAQVLQAIGLKSTGKRVPALDSPVTLGTLRGGWRIVFFARKEITNQPSYLSKASSGCEIVVCFVEEHVMVSVLALWRNGEQVWQVSHDAQVGMMDLKVVGQPPEPFSRIRDELFAEQKAEGGAKADVDLLFDIPTRLAQSITGYKHDAETPGFDNTNCEELQGSEPLSKPSFIKRLFGF